MGKPEQSPGSARGKRQILLVAGLLAIGLTLWVRTKSGPPSASSLAIMPDDVAYARYAGPQSCRECHAQQFNLWSRSHHAAAERPIDLTGEKASFDPTLTLKQAGFETRFVAENNKPEMLVTSTNRETTRFPLDRVLGVAPLYQFLVPFPGGRWQLTEAAFDPAKREWFDVFGEARFPGEWGHWTGRGMNWNSVCAGCHNTRLRKNYEPRTDSYNTRMAGIGVNCEACHGPRKEHAEWRQVNRGDPHDPTVQPLSRDQMLAVCGSCHARRTELTGDFKPGDSFFDHYALSIPDAGELFYADGQVKEEDFEFTSFLSSKMHAAGVRCGDCHEPHSGALRVADNHLCMRCHAGAALPGILLAPKIDPLQHSHHKAGSSGNNCVECHMPRTNFMQRHARRDHGFILPDPILTREHGIPNACNRCHKEQPVDWAARHFEEWYGPGKERPARIRAETIARARKGETAAVPGLLKLLESERVPLWRATASVILESWSHQPEVRNALLQRTSDPHPLVRVMAAHSLQSALLGNDPAIGRALALLLNDPVRAVRVEAAWALHSTLSTNSIAGADLLRWLEQNRDQPGGLLNLGMFLNDRGRADQALEHFETAISWDPNSAPLRQVFATALSARSRLPEAVRHLQKACEIEPRNPHYPYLLALALNETGQLELAVASLEKAVALDPGFANAWYNLGLGYSARGDQDRALEALQRAEALEPASARAPYARATVLLRLGRLLEARAAAQKALSIDPNHAEAAELLRSGAR